MLALRAAWVLKTLKYARLDNTHEQELRKLVALDLLIVDGDFQSPSRELRSIDHANRALTSTLFLALSGWASARSRSAVLLRPSK